MLNFVSSLLSLSAGDRPDALPLSLVRQISSLPRLTDCLPYLGWLQDSELFVLDGSVYDSSSRLYLGFAFEVLPQVGASESMEQVLHNLLMTLPVNSGIQISLWASPDITPVLDQQISMVASQSNEVYSRLYQLRRDYYMGGTTRSLFRHGFYLLRDFRCVLSVVLPLSPFVPADIDQAIQLRESVKIILRSAYLPNSHWSPNILVSFCHRFFDPRYLFGDWIAKHPSYDPMQTLRNQIRNSEVAIALDDYQMRLASLDGCESSIRVFSVRQYPTNFTLAAMGSLIGDAFQSALSIPSPFLITMGCIIQDFDSTRNKAYLKSARATQMAESMFAKWQPELRDRKLDWDAVLRTFDDGGSLVKLYHQIVLISRPDDMSRAEHALRSVWQARGFDLMNDYYFQHQALAAALPLTLTPALQADLNVLARSYTKTTRSAVVLAPLVAEWKGTSTPVITLFGRRGQIMSFDLFDNQGGNYNFAVAALSGSGKSVLVNELSMRYLACGSKVWIIDVGRSYQNLCNILGGEFIEFTQNANLCLNPFSMVIDINSDMEMILPIVAQMAFPRGGINDFEYALLGNLIKDVWDAKGNAGSITDIYDLAKARVDESCGDMAVELRRLLVTLLPYTVHGVYASYFNGAANIDFSNTFIVLELEELKSRKDLQSLILQIIMYRITQEMYLDRSRRKLVIIDEAWDLLGGNTSAAFIEAGYRRARKYRGSFGMITQSVDDFYKNDASMAALNNADWLFLLRQRIENIERLGKEGKLHVDEYMRRLLMSVSTEHGMYSEIFVSCPSGSGVGRLLLDPFTMLLYSTRAEDYEAINHYRKNGLSTIDAIMRVMEDRKRAEP